MSESGSKNKIVTYLLMTALMVVTFVCAIAISHDFYSGIAWLVLLASNVGILVYLSMSTKQQD